MTSPFHTRIAQSLANPGLQEALDGNAERRLQARQSAFSSLPEDLQILRQRAHTVRARTIADLDYYLEQFVQQAEKNGFILHRARNSAEANQIVLQIVQDSGAKLVAKSKTMVGEEIRINETLEAAGVEVVETDLGEYIIQLRGEPPAHIITPAVHLRRSDVGRTFQEKLGIPYTEDIPDLTTAARGILRQTFLRAEVGISGANFGVAENGAICLLTNEGNGRMVTTLPPVHIALLGIERLLPSLDDLALMLYLLPRHATGQKLTVYTSLIQSPRREGEVDGALQRHIVLVDNGRSSLLGSPLEEILYCIRCGACLNACPVFREIGGHGYVGLSGQHTPYPGPIGSVLSAGLFGQVEFSQLARASSLCGACKEACPVDIDLPKLLLRVRAGGLELNSARSDFPAKTPPNVPLALNWGLRIFSWAARSPGRFHLAQRLLGVFGRLVAPNSEWLRLPALTGWGYGRDFPKPEGRTFGEGSNQIISQLDDRSTGQLGIEGSDLVISQSEDQATSQIGNWAIGEGKKQVIKGSEDQLVGQLGIEGSNQSIRGSEDQESGKSGEAIERQVDRFEAELVALGGSFVRCEEAELLEQVLGWLKEKRVRRVLAWEAGYLPGGLLDALKGAGIEVLHQPDAEAQAGLSGVLAGIAETGTLVMAGGVGRPQSTSLLPERHLAVLRASDILDRMEQALHLPDARQASSVALISGPSRTADIEMTLTIGVHGPGELRVVCVM